MRYDAMVGVVTVEGTYSLELMSRSREWNPPQMYNNNNNDIYSTIQDSTYIHKQNRPRSSPFARPWNFTCGLLRHVRHSPSTGLHIYLGIWRASTAGPTGLYYIPESRSILATPYTYAHTLSHTHTHPTAVMPNGWDPQISLLAITVMDLRPSRRPGVV
jgi:hypothetical protein